MADDKTPKDDDDEPVVVEVDQLPPPGETPKLKAEASEDDEPPEEDDAPGEDARLAEHEDDEDEPPSGEDSAAKKKRLKRRQIQKQARDRTLHELAELRAFKQTAEARFIALEGANISTSAAQIDARLAETRRDIDTAGRILAKAIEAGNGEDAAAALALRDDAKAVELTLVRQKDGLTEARKPKPPGADPQVLALSNQWKAANTWYDARGGDDDSAIVNAIDNRLAAEGYNPATVDYWNELTRRVKSRLRPEPQVGERPNGAARRTPPPQGASREYAPPSTRTEVYVTPERKQAMIDAGKWDDPSERSKMLKAYAAYDREQSASR